MIQEDAPRAKAFPHIVEPSRALKGIISVVEIGITWRRNPSLAGLTRLS